MYDGPMRVQVEKSNGIAGEWERDRAVKRLNAFTPSWVWTMRQRIEQYLNRTPHGRDTFCDEIIA